ncbi:MAG: 3-deoxy-D-manno-octulosonic acid transferase [Chitinophagaceae bacterium]|nr:3-deoxy-D-manno-octulosonic acid transferase [Chitinophagaceae bacterium]
MSKFIYHIFIGLYALGIRIASLGNAKARMWITGRKNFPAIRQTLKNNTVWMHCASLGEFEQGRPLVEKIKILDPGVQIVITFFSPSGYEVMKNYPGADYIFYLPVDSPLHAKRFIDNITPTLVLWIKYEYWFYYLKELKKRNIPVLLISGIFRKEQPFFKWYGGIWKEMLHCFTHLFVQNEASRELLQQYFSITNISIAGDTRFDRVIDTADNFEPVKEIEAFIGNTEVIVAGSTWTEDDEELDHYANTNIGISFIIAPHEISKERLTECLKLYKHSMLYSEWIIAKKEWEGEYVHSPVAGINCLVIDNIGLLKRLYQYATICYVGGGFGQSGIHNILEAAVYGKPVIFGPEYGKFAEAAALIEKGGAISIDCALELEKEINALLTDEKLLAGTGNICRDYVRENAGATHKIISYIQENRLLIN